MNNSPETTEPAEVRGVITLISRTAADVLTETGQGSLYTPCHFSFADVLAFWYSPFYTCAHGRAIVTQEGKGSHANHNVQTEVKKTV